MNDYSGQGKGGGRGRRPGKPGYHGNRPPRRDRHNQNSIDPSLFVNIAKERLATPSAPQTHESFSSFGLDPLIMDNLDYKGYVKPTPIQDQTIPLSMKGSDVLGIANTGTGKTAAFALPLIQKILNDRTERVLIMAPTRELALQIDEEVRSFTFGLNIGNAVLIGGTTLYPQISQIKRNPHIVIGTPGRIKDLISRGDLVLSTFRSVVLDEMDRMLDMGFIHDVRDIMLCLPRENRQTLFFSATITPEIERLIRDFLRPGFAHVSVKVHETPDHIEQKVIKASGYFQKLDALSDLLKLREFEKVIVFGRTKRGVERLSQDLYRRGFHAGSIHGDKPQMKREQVLRLFKQNRLNVLVATDVAARGIDVSNITHVINFDQPASYEDYVHRIGRTGRADKYGTAITFVD